MIGIDPRLPTLADVDMWMRLSLRYDVSLATGREPPSGNALFVRRADAVREKLLRAEPIEVSGQRI